MIDVDKLPPTQYLILDVLAARHRLGELWWTLPSRLQRALDALQEVGLVATIHGITEHTVRSRLTGAGRAAVLLDSYVPPLLQVRGVRCIKCGSPLAPCDDCGQSSLCGDAWCQEHIPNGSWR